MENYLLNLLQNKQETIIGKLLDTTIRLNVTDDILININYLWKEPNIQFVNLQ